MLKGERFLVIFGGWDYPRSVFLNDTHLLKLEGYGCGSTTGGGAAPVWSTMRTSGVAPVPRCQTSAVQLEGDLLMVFGGACHAPVITERQQRRRERRRRAAREDRGLHGSDSSDGYDSMDDEDEKVVAPFQVSIYIKMVDSIEYVH